MSNPYELELATGLAAVRLAAEICQTVQAGITLDVLDKRDKSPVTIADYASQAVICRAISMAFPADEIVAEEDSSALSQIENSFFQGEIERLIRTHIPSSTTSEICHWIDCGNAKGGSNRFWTLDPIDGTKGFLRKDQYAISLALIIDGQIAMGILACPNLGSVVGGGNTLFFATRGHGAFGTGLDPASVIRQIRVTQTIDPAGARLCESFEAGHSSHDESSTIAQWLGIRSRAVRMDSQAKYAAVATGAADVYLRLPTKKDYSEKIWDHAGGVLIVEEAGGRVTDLSGKSLDFAAGRELVHNRGVVVTNGALHAAVLAAAQSVVGTSL